MMKTKICSFLICLLSIPLAASADIVQPVAATATSNFFTPPENLISGLGLIDNGGSVETQLHNNVEDQGWIANGNADEQELEFELSVPHDLTGMYIWQHNGLDGGGNVNLNRGLNNFEVLVSPDLMSPYTSVGTFSLAQAVDPTVGPPGGEAAQAFTLSGLGLDSVMRVKFDIIDAHGGPTEPNVGLGEVRFEGSAVPEPTGVVLLLAGLLAICHRLRRLS